MRTLLKTLFALLVVFGSNMQSRAQSTDKSEPGTVKNAQASKTRSAKTPDGKFELATFGGGCFWCVESVFENVKGVVNVVSGYSGDNRLRYANPTYQLVLSHKTMHAEVCQITYDPAVITYKELLEIFWKTHDPTTKDRQGPDSGPQYRSVVFTHSDEQQELAEKYKKRLNDEKAFAPRTVLTEVEPIGEFYLAELYHQDYFRKNPNDGYCNTFARPKIEKLRAAFADKVK